MSSKRSLASQIPRSEQIEEDKMRSKKIILLFISGSLMLGVIGIAAAGYMLDKQHKENSAAGKVLGVMEKSPKASIKKKAQSGIAAKQAKPTSTPPVKKKAPGKELKIKANNFVVVDVDEKSVIAGRDFDKKHSIASITKLMTALVALDMKPDWKKKYKLAEQDKREGGKIYLYVGDEVKTIDLFRASLIASDNIATLALVHSLGFTEKQFAKKMNEKAKSMGLVKTNFNDVTGLSKYNVSTASEVAKFAEAAISRKEISSILTMKKYELKVSKNRKKTIFNTDKLLDIFPRNNISLIGGKTGFTNEAGYCFVGKFKDKGGNEVVSVVLDTDDLHARFSDTKTIIDWAFGKQ